MPTFTCATCGNAFTLHDEVLARYPNWTPKACRSCRDAGGGQGAAKGAGKRTAKSGGRPRGVRGKTLIEENLTLAEVLAKYEGGPQDGVFTDGSANPNPGPGGWGAAYVVDGEVVGQAHGKDPDTTNNRMELTAVIEGIDLVPEGTPATLYTDSRLVVDTLTKWAGGWERAGWRRQTGEVQNLDLVKAAYERVRARPEICLEWIAAHSGARWNEYADSLSTAYLREQL